MKRLAPISDSVTLRERSFCHNVERYPFPYSRPRAMVWWLLFEKTAGREYEILSVLIGVIYYTTTHMAKYKYIERKIVIFRENWPQKSL